jgi:hypothetical protein
MVLGGVGVFFRGASGYNFGVLYCRIDGFVVVGLVSDLAIFWCIKRALL